MSKDEKIAYEPHPVSPERKAELRAQGFKIIDARFDPRAAAGMTPESEARALVIADLQAKGVDHDPDASIHELQALNITPQDGKEPAPKTAKQPKAAKQPAEPQDGKE